MTNQVIHAGSIGIPAQESARLSARSALDTHRGSHRITDRRLIRKVRVANGGGKRALDVIVASFALLFFAPAFALIALLIKASDNGPIFYSHRRIGRHAERFMCLKFRTMAVDAEERLAHILLTDPAAAAEWRETQKLRCDPRVTKIGAFLRRTSLDELPQFWNVLRGEMSVVGPRPITRAELNRYGRDRRYYLLVKPGITGLWQVSGRSSTTYDTRVRFDRQYLEEWSWLGELWIMLMTLPAILKTNDAC
jgi:lipopolysaccharide/colanic/teichoic acid biosynthesis glycosyltransferase